MSNSHLNGFVDAWIEQTASVLSQSSGMPWTSAVVETATLGADAVFVGFTTSGSLHGEFGFNLAPADALRFAAALLGDDGATEFLAEHREVLDEIFRQIAGLVTSAIKPLVGAAELVLSECTVPAWTAGHTVFAKFTHDELSASFALLCSSDLCAALTPAAEPPAVEQLPTAGEQVARFADQGNLELLLDVELGVTLRFGERRLLLREILELSSGSVVELDRQVHEPVDLLVDDRLVARGEVVIVGGNYGLRVTEVASPSHRMNAIR